MDKTQAKQAVYDQLVELVKASITDDFDVTEEPGRFNVDTRKPVVIADRPRPNVNLLSIIIQKNHVGFYFIPVYMDEGLRAGLSDTLAKMLKGKSCFHCKQELPPELADELTGLIHAGVDLYRHNEWI